MQAMENAWTCFDIIFSEEVRDACLIHGDLNLANIFIDNGKLSAFIDPLNTMYADREYDLFQFNNLTGKRFKLSQTYIEKYGASKYCKEKLAFYGLWNEVFCYIKSGVLVNVIMNPLVKNMMKSTNKFLNRPDYERKILILFKCMSETEQQARISSFGTFVKKYIEDQKKC